MIGLRPNAWPMCRYQWFPLAQKAGGTKSNHAARLHHFESSASNMIDANKKKHCSLRDHWRYCTDRLNPISSPCLWALKLRQSSRQILIATNLSPSEHIHPYYNFKHSPHFLDKICWNKSPTLPQIPTEIIVCIMNDSHDKPKCS